jgi:uncharacterized ParB-like nuclease family protein
MPFEAIIRPLLPQQLDEAKVERMMKDLKVRTHRCLSFFFFQLDTGRKCGSRTAH